MYARLCKLGIAVFVALIFVWFVNILIKTIENNFVLLNYVCVRSAWCRSYFRYALIRKYASDYTEDVLQILMLPTYHPTDIYRNSGMIAMRNDSVLNSYYHYLLTNEMLSSSGYRQLALQKIYSNRDESAIPLLLLVANDTNDVLSGSAFMLLSSLTNIESLIHIMSNNVIYPEKRSGRVSNDQLSREQTGRGGMLLSDTPEPGE